MTDSRTTEMISLMEKQDTQGNDRQKSTSALMQRWDTNAKNRMVELLPIMKHSRSKGCFGTSEALAGCTYAKDNKINRHECYIHERISSIAPHYQKLSPQPASKLNSDVATFSGQKEDCKNYADLH